MEQNDPEFDSSEYDLCQMYVLNFLETAGTTKTLNDISKNASQPTENLNMTLYTESEKLGYFWQAILVLSVLDPRSAISSRAIPHRKLSLQRPCQKESTDLNKLIEEETRIRAG